MKERLTDVDMVKGLAMLTVLWNHSFILVPINIHERWWSIWLQDINATFFVCVFFLVSGYLFNSSSLKKPNYSTLVKKLKRLLIPFLSFSLLNYLMKVIAPSLVNKQVGSFSEYAYKVVVGGGIMVPLRLVPHIPYMDGRVTLCAQKKGDMDSDSIVCN